MQNAKSHGRQLMMVEQRCATFFVALFKCPILQPTFFQSQKNLSCNLHQRLLPNPRPSKRNNLIKKSFPFSAYPWLARLRKYFSFVRFVRFCKIAACLKKDLPKSETAVAHCHQQQLFCKKKIIMLLSDLNASQLNALHDIKQFIISYMLCKAVMQLRR